MDFLCYLQNYQVQEQGDNVSEPSEAASLNSDSGRGSNEDADSRPSSSENDHLRHSQGKKRLIITYEI